MATMQDVKWSNELVTEATELPLSLEDIRAHCRISDRLSDQTLTQGLLAAVRYAETIQKRSYVLKTFKLRMDRFPREIVLPKPPLSSVTSIKYIDSNGTTITLATDQYETDLLGDPGRVRPAFNVGIWPVTRDVYNAVVVEYVAGYANQQQETRVTPANIEVSDVYNILIDGEVVATFIAAAATVSSVVTGLVAAFSYTGITASDETTHVKLLGTSGVPFGVETTATEGGTTDTQEMAIETVVLAQTIPEDVRHALRLLVQHWDVNREAAIVGTITQSLAHTVRDLLAGGKVYAF